MIYYRHSRSNNSYCQLMRLMRVYVRAAVGSFLFLMLAVSFVAAAEDFDKRLRGRILLDVQQNGEAWYVKPTDGTRVFMGRPDDAFRIMRQLGVGITNEDLRRIPIAEIPFLFSRSDDDNDGLPPELEKSFGTDPQKADTDGDGYSDKEEMENGHDPVGNGKLPIDTRFAAKKKGTIFLQVESAGEAWYVNPADNRRYYLGRPYDAWNIMKTTGLGISVNDLFKIKESIVEHPIVFDPDNLTAGKRVGTTQVRSIEKRTYPVPREPDYTIHFVGELTLSGEILTDEKCIQDLDQSSRERVPRTDRGVFDGRICFVNTAQLDKAIESKSIKQKSRVAVILDNLILNTDNAHSASYSAEFLDISTEKTAPWLDNPQATGNPGRSDAYIPSQSDNEQR